MRAFIAIDLPDALHAALAEAPRELRRAAPEARWSKPEGIHLTLKFLGEISDAQTKYVVEALTQLGPFEPFEIGVKGFGFFPSERGPRVFWAGVAAPPALAELASQIDARLARIGFAREDRAFSPHLTLARFKVPRPQPELLAAIATQPEIPLGKFKASEFFLFESKLSPQGSQYKKIMRFPRQKE